MLKKIIYKNFKFDKFPMEFGIVPFNLLPSKFLFIITNIINNKYIILILIIILIVGIFYLKYSQFF